jgi:hypothetical protein
VLRSELRGPVGVEVIDLVDAAQIPHGLPFDDLACLRDIGSIDRVVLVAELVASDHHEGGAHLLATDEPVLDLLTGGIAHLCLLSPTRPGRPPCVCRTDHVERIPVGARRVSHGLD